VPDSAESRITYINDVMAAAPGEPKIDKAAALVLLEKLRAGLAKPTAAVTASIKANIGESAGSLIVPAGMSAHLLVGGEARAFPMCSEAFLGAAMIESGIGPEDFAKAGMRGLLCKSDGCSAVFDMRPTSSGGGLYGGTSCLGMQDVVKLLAH
jgi:hypothetical protein